MGKIFFAGLRPATPLGLPPQTPAGVNTPDPRRLTLAAMIMHAPSDPPVVAQGLSSHQRGSLPRAHPGPRQGR